MNEENLLTVADVAKRLKVNNETIRRWLRQGRLRGVLLGGNKMGYRIPESELRRLMSVSDER